MRRFFFQEEQRQNDRVFLGSSESHHISRVLRLKEGEWVELCGQDGSVYPAEIVGIGPNVELALSEPLPEKNTGGRLIVGQGVIKTKNMEFILQKCTELGVDDFHPFGSARSQGNIIQRYRGRDERWRRIIVESCKQCERSAPMQLHDICSFQELVSDAETVGNDLKLLFWEKEKETTLHDFAQVLASTESVMILLGPEGGFAEEEIHMAKKFGWHCVGLGERILRAETAAIAATSLVQHYRGQM